MPENIPLGVFPIGVSAASVAAAATANAQYGLLSTVSVSNTVAETTLLAAGAGSLTLPANIMRAGEMLFIYGYGTITNTSTPTIQIKVKIGGVTVLDTTATTMLTITGTTQWQLSAQINCRTVGAGGTGFAQAQFNYFSTPTVSNIVQMINTSTFALNTTISNVIDVTATWGAASASNTINSTNMNMVLLG
jgi:hypothetical protein